MEQGPAPRSARVREYLFFLPRKRLDTFDGCKARREMELRSPFQFQKFSSRDEGGKKRLPLVNSA